MLQTNSANVTDCQAAGVVHGGPCDVQVRAVGKTLAPVG